MFDFWKQRVRRWLLEYLRPGQDMAEMLDLIGNADAILSEEQRRMLENMAEFHDTRVRELMVPRSEIRAVSVNAGLDDVEKAFVKSDVSRMLVIQDDLDHVEGVVHVWDIFKARTNGEAFSLKTLLRPCLKVQEQQQVLGLLVNMKQEGKHLAVVLDEYGGTAGLVTLTDLLSEIMGSLDEHVEESENEEYEDLGDGRYLIEARMHVEDFEDLLKVSLPKGEYDTLAGLITNHLGRIPAKGESLEVAGLPVQVIEADPRRVTKVRIDLGDVQPQVD